MLATRCLWIMCRGTSAVPAWCDELAGADADSTDTGVGCVDDGLEPAGNSPLTALWPESERDDDTSTSSSSARPHRRGVLWDQPRETVPLLSQVRCGLFSASRGLLCRRSRQGIEALRRAKSVGREEDGTGSLTSRLTPRPSPGGFQERDAHRGGSLRMERSMSTRCQVRVYGAFNESRTLYHHCDGYPSNMLPLIQRGYALSGKGWEAGRAGKMASFLCAADPGSFEPEDDHGLHGDIEWYYRVYATGETACGTTPLWHVAIYQVAGWDENQQLIPVGGRWTLDDAVNMANEIEAGLKTASHTGRGLSPPCSAPFAVGPTERMGTHDPTL
jgi:hypothetical protein